MRRSCNRKNLTRARLAHIALEGVGQGLRASRAMQCCGGGTRKKCDIAIGAPSRPDRNGNHGINSTSRGFGDKILKFYF